MTASDRNSSSMLLLILSCCLVSQTTPTAKGQANCIAQLDEALIAQAPPTQAGPVTPSPKQEATAANAGSSEAAQADTRRGSSAESSALGLEAAQGQYMAYVRAKIRKANERMMPREWIKDVLRDNVSADFSLVIKRDGQILSTRLLRSSGYSMLDDYARRAISTASPFEGFPQAAGNTIIFTVTIYYFSPLQTPDRAQVSMTQAPSTLTLSDRAKRQLQDKLESVSATLLQVVDVDGAPLEINDPKATSIKIEGNYDAPPDLAPMINDYVMKLRFRLVNRTGQRVTGAGIEVTNTQENNTFFVYPNPMEIEPGKSKNFEIPFMAVTGDPAYLSVQLAGARFGDGTTWGGFPFPRSRRSGTPPTSTAAPFPPQVDTKPRVLNSAQPRYTEEARRNHVLGAVDLRLLVGIDGEVKQVRVTKALPDGLTEQAIRAAYELRFEPAKKNGEPVEYWMPVMVEFNLK